MKVTGKLSSGCSSLILSALLVISATTVRADSDSDHTPNFGVRGNRITSNCEIQGGVLGPCRQVPPPATISSNDPCQGKVVALDKSPNSRWSVDISWFDPATEKLYVADRNNGGTDVFDTKMETAVGLAGGSVGLQPVTPAGVTPAVAR